MKRVLLIGASILAVSGVTPDYANSSPISVAVAEVSYPDIKGHWAQKDIEYLASKGAINGFPDGTFKPNGTVTRAQFSKIFADLMGVKSDRQVFSTMKGHWAESQVNGLVEIGVIIPREYPKGYNHNLQITRLEMAKMIARGLTKESTKWNDVVMEFTKLEYIKLPFKDQDSLNPADYAYLALANGSGIVSGKGDGSFSPNGLATRAEVAVMLKRLLDAKDRTPDVAQLVTKFKGAKPIHQYTKEEMENWINKEADLNRIRSNPIQNEEYRNNLKIFNDFIHTLRQLEFTDKNYIQAAKGYMEIFYNRDYRTIGEQYKNDLKFYIKSNQVHKGIEYTTKKTLPKYFDVIVEDTRKEKQISESIFITDVSMYHQIDDGATEDRVRGTQYIRYISGTNLPKGIQLNKWYKRDIDLQITNFGKNIYSTVKWDTVGWAYDDLYPITPFVEVKR